MNTLFVLTHIPNPRMNKRIKAANSLGQVGVVCIRRNNQDVYEPALSQVPHHILETNLPSAANPLKRALASLRFFKFALKKLKNEAPDLLYTASLDSLLVARAYQLFHPKVRIVLEVADVREAYLRDNHGIKRKLLSFVEKRLYSHVCLLVLTSEQFFTQYYHRYFPKDKVLVQQNRPDLAAFSTFQKKQGGPFTVGFIGGIRYLEQMKMLVDSAQAAGVAVLFAGAGGTSSDMDAITAYCQGKGHVRFTGKYKYDQDIAALYGSVDCVYAVYDADNPNVRIALPNKLYEAAYCGLPLLVARGTYLSEVVETNSLGYAVSHKEVSELTSLLSRLKSQDLQQQEGQFAEAGKRFLDGLPQQDLAGALTALAAKEGK